MIEVAVGSLPSNVSLEGRAVRDMAGSETDCSEGMDEVALGRIASLPLEPFPPRDFRGKFKKMRHKKRPTILESRYCFDDHLRNSFFFFLSVRPFSFSAITLSNASLPHCICLCSTRGCDGLLLLRWEKASKYLYSLFV